ncbi:prosaposin [Scaptodrosophila lebanonensis]|uniref:Prosaposin n=1 Tax=Drosophila lebanonensis TaxID=7225 RepID=A0A6J2T344_DROLE|nr:prosaposin [Scaptodrosophila lebanonensis]
MRNSSAGLLAIVAVVVLGVCSATPIEQPLVGASKCTWGPTYWCANLSNSKDCKATRHCIQTVWEKRDVEVDNDSICKICKDMVTQARDQLRSNETQEELKEVFEGSCNLIPIKLIKKECDKLADDFVPELIEALSSQMNPDQVCTVAGLCNNAKIDELYKQYIQSALDGTLKPEDEPESTTTAVGSPKTLTCGNCNLLSRYMQQKFELTNRDDMVENLLHVCGGLSSFSDACANIVLTYFNDIFDHVKQHLQTDGMCHVSGVCASKYHQHKDDVQEPEPLSSLDGGDDIPCQLCEQLVRHLRDVLVANTTETEFKQVLEGFCKQTRSFKSECLSIVDQYYHVIYSTLVNDMDPNGACFMIGVCPKQLDKTFDAPIMPLLPAIAPAEVVVTIKKLGSNEPKFTQDELIGMTLPIDQIMGAANPGLLVEGGELCTLCEYLLHFVQEELATPATEDEVKHTVESICHRMPRSIDKQCDNFVEQYGDAVIALLIQGLNPATICPKMQMCPHNKNHEDVEVFHPLPIDHQDKPTCPLCLFAVEQAQAKIRDNKSKENIKRVLDGLCAHLPNKLAPECKDFVETYSNELIDMLITDFKPQEICVQLKLCPKQTDYLDEMGISLEDDSDEDKSNSGELAFNAIESDESPYELAFDQDFSALPNCELCKLLVKEANKIIKNRKSKDEIKRALDHSCDALKSTFKRKCHSFIKKHGDQLAAALMKATTPKVVCRIIGQCPFFEDDDAIVIDDTLKYEIIEAPSSNAQLERLEQSPMEPPTCVLCEFVLAKLEMELQNKTEQDEIKRIIETICTRLPKTVRKQCDAFVADYASTIIDLLTKVPPKQVCQKLQLCLSQAITDEVIECGVCHGATQVLLPHIRGQLQHEELRTQDMTEVACENVPAKYYSICSEMISIYGISIMHLAQQPEVDQAHVCSKIGKCFDTEKSSLAFARISN